MRFTKSTLLLAQLILAPAVGQALGTNVLLNPDFDSSPADWTVYQGTGVLDSEDSDACSASHSLHVDSLGVTPGAVARIRQCVALPGGTVRVRFRARVVAGSVDHADVEYSTWSTSDCSGSPVDSGGSPPGALATAWTTFDTGPLTLGGSSIMVYAAVIGNFSFAVLYDRLFVGSADEIFVDDSEIGESCRWSATLP